MELREFQKRGAEWLFKTFKGILADEMGLGKTVQAVELINRAQGIERVLIVCPASLKGNWLNEINTWLKRPLSKEILSGRQSFPIEQDIIICNYDILEARLEDLLNRPEDSNGHVYDLVIFDEAHYLKNATAKRTQAAGSLFGRTQRLVFLTGTPLVNRPADLWVMLQAIAPEIAKDQRAFEIRYCGGHLQKLRFGSKTVTRWFNMGATHIEELNQKIAPFVLRRLKANVLTELPAKIHQIIELEVADEFKSVLLDGNWWENLTPSIVSATAEARRRCGEAKVRRVIEHVKMLLEEKDKVIVFGHHKKVVHAIAEAFNNPAVITGETPAKNRTDIVKKFQTDPMCRVFVGNIVAAGAGITLTASDVVVFAELDWVPGNMRQAEDRAHRIGQKNSVLIQYLVAPGVDAEIGRALAKKIEVIEAVIDGKK